MAAKPDLRKIAKEYVMKQVRTFQTPVAAKDISKAINKVNRVLAEIHAARAAYSK